MTGPDWRPPYAYMPGRNARHDEALFDWIKATVSGVPMADLPQTEAWQMGLAFLRDGFFWECHEVLEPVWMACAPNSAEAEHLRGVIQLANAALKARLGAGKAARRLQSIAQTHLEEANRRRVPDGFAVPDDVMAAIARRICDL